MRIAHIMTMMMMNVMMRMMRMMVMMQMDMMWINPSSSYVTHHKADLWACMEDSVYQLQLLVISSMQLCLFLSNLPQFTQENGGMIKRRTNVQVFHRNP